jgi:hypothetical protein
MNNYLVVGRACGTLGKRRSTYRVMAGKLARRRPIGRLAYMGR